MKIKETNYFNMFELNRKDEAALLQRAVNVDSLQRWELPKENIYNRIIRNVEKNKSKIAILEVSLKYNCIQIDINFNLSVTINKDNIRILKDDNEIHNCFGIEQDLPFIERFLDDELHKENKISTPLSDEAIKHFKEKFNHVKIYSGKFEYIDFTLLYNEIKTNYAVDVILRGNEAMRLLNTKEYGGSSAVLLYNFWAETING